MCPIGSVFFTLRKWAAAQHFKLTLDCVRLAPFSQSKKDTFERVQINRRN